MMNKTQHKFKHHSTDFLKAATKFSKGGFLKKKHYDTLFQHGLQHLIYNEKTWMCEI